MTTATDATTAYTMPRLPSPTGSASSKRFLDATAAAPGILVTIKVEELPAMPNCSPRRPLVVTHRMHKGEVWLSWAPLDEHGVGATDSEARDRLWASLCTYMGMLEEDESHLSPRLRDQLETLRHYIERH